MKNSVFSISKGIICSLLAITMWQCIPQKEIKYLQDKEPSNFQPLDGITDKYFLQPNDYLFINISSMDPKLSDFFNQTSSTGSNMGGTNQNMYYYLIDDSMNIDFPYAGNINLKGCNLKMAKARIKEALKPFLNDAIINVKLANCQFTILGEVKNVGPKNMSKDQITIFEAIGLAGDMTTFGKRSEIKLVRKYPNETKTYIIDLTDQNIVNSEFYYIYPNDFIYVRPMKAKMFGITETITLGIVASALGLYLAIYSIANN